MDQSETEPEGRRQIPTLVWIFLGAVLLAMFAALVLLVGRPPAIVGPAPAANPMAPDQGPPRREPGAAKLD